MNVVLINKQWTL